MILLGILLLAVGLLLYFLTPPPVSQIGLVCTIIGAILLIVGIVLLADEGGIDVHSVILLR